MTAEAFILIAAMLAADTSSTLPQPTPHAPAHAAAGYIVRVCRPSGQFEYRINTDPAVRVKPKYNMLRHAGTIYALATYEKRHPSAVTRAAISRAVGFMKQNALGGVGTQTNMLAIWSRPAINGGSAPPNAKLGGAGLGLIAMVSAHRVAPTSIDLDSLRKLARFLMYMQEDDGRFISKYVPGEGGRSDTWASLYYPGEAALGLVMLYEIDPDPLWLDTATRAIFFLARSRQGKQDLPADHWALLATARLLKLPQADESVGRNAILCTHAEDLCRSILAAASSNIRQTGFRGNSLICPTATRLEGLIAALPHLSDPLLRTDVEQAIGEGIAFLLDTQLGDAPWTGAWHRAAARLDRSHPAYSKAFNRRATEIRIDYVQHALSALLMFEKQKAIRTP